jgi:choline dehydrogenase
MKKQTYDYIIIGAGSAGCVLANRLTKNPDITVLLLEAGNPDQNQAIHIPAAFSHLLKSEFDWAYFTEPQPHLNQRQLYWPRGKVLGGSSSLNAMIYIRGNAQDYDHWHALGNPGWSFADLLPYFKKAEHQERGANEYHGIGGPLNVADLREVNPLSYGFVAAGIEAGLPHNFDFNGKSQDGVGLYQVTQKNGKRCSTAVAYLKPVLSRSNLTVQTQAQITRILFEGTRATGVAYVRGGQGMEAGKEGERRETVAIAQEIILSGGAINSPQLLMLSGVGPADQLQTLNIPVVADLPGVGQNLQDHLHVPVIHHCTQPISLLNAEKPIHLLKYHLFKTGMLTSNVAEAGGFIKTRSDLSKPNLQLHFLPAYFRDHGFTRSTEHSFSCSATLLTPQSRGHITLSSSDPFTAPQIQPNYLTEDADLQTLGEGVELIRQILASPAMDAVRGAEVFPTSPCKTSQEIREFIRNSVETLYHPVGTCKMGTDSMSVVNSQLQVHGVSGLRIVDASIMPTIVSGNTNAPTIAIAEKAADLILQREWGMGNGES